MELDGRRTLSTLCTRQRLSRPLIQVLPMPIEVPPLGIREIELPRIIQAYADEAIAALSAPASCFSGDDQALVTLHSWPTSVASARPLPNSQTLSVWSADAE